MIHTAGGEDRNTALDLVFGRLVYFSKTELLPLVHTAYPDPSLTPKIPDCPGFFFMRGNSSRSYLAKFERTIFELYRFPAL